MLTFCLNFAILCGLRVFALKNAFVFSATSLREFPASRGLDANRPVPAGPRQVDDVLKIVIDFVRDPCLFLASTLTLSKGFDSPDSHSVFMIS